MTMEDDRRPKRQLTPEQLQKLAAAREKALEKRRQLAELNKKEKALKEVELIDRMKRVGIVKEKESEHKNASVHEKDGPEDEMVEIVKPKNKMIVPAAVKHRKTIIVADSSDSSSDDNDEVEVLCAV